MRYALILPWLLSLLFFFPLFSSFFFQDDFLLLIRADVHSLSDFFRLFVGQKDVIFYRPLSMGVFFWITGSLFGKTYFWYKVMTLLLHGVNIFLVQKIARRFVEERPSLLIVLFYAVHPAHFVALYWLSEINLVIGQTFFFGSILFALSRARWRSLFLFISALLSSEFAVTLPVVLLFLLRFKRERWSRLIRTLGPIWIILGIYGLFRFTLFPPMIAATYVPRFDGVTLQTLFWYVVRALGLPETFSLREAMTSADAYAWVMVTLFVVFVVFIVIEVLQLSDHRTRFVGIAWFVIALSPVLFLSEHKLAAYAGFGLPGFALAVSARAPRVMVGFGVVFLALSFLGMRHQVEHHWVVARAETARDVLGILDQQYPSGLPPRIHIADGPTYTSEAIYFSLVEDSAFRFWFKNPPDSVTYSRWVPMPPGATAISF